MRKKLACKREQGEDIRVNIGIKVRLRNDNGSSSTNPDKKTPLVAKNEQKLPAKKKLITGGVLMAGFFEGLLLKFIPFG